MELSENAYKVADTKWSCHSPKSCWISGTT